MFNEFYSGNFEKSKVIDFFQGEGIFGKPIYNTPEKRQYLYKYLHNLNSIDKNRHHPLSNASAPITSSPSPIHPLKKSSIIIIHSLLAKKTTGTLSLLVIPHHPDRLCHNNNLPADGMWNLGNKLGDNNDRHTRHHNRSCSCGALLFQSYYAAVWFLDMQDTGRVIYGGTQDTADF